MRRFFYIIFFLSAIISIAQSSVFSSGTWYKIGVTETGIYKIDRNTLDILGIPSSIDPRKISILGNGIKGILPQSNAVDRPQDLLENSIFVSGESDGSFDQNDYVLFYGVGPHLEQWTESGFEYQRNIYADTAYYFIRIGETNGVRIESQPSLVGSPTDIVNSFDDHLTFEEDVNNLISSGRGWYGETMNSGELHNQSYQIDGIDSEINLLLSAVSQSSEGGNFMVSVNDSQVGSLPIQAVPDGPGTTYSIKARQEEGSFTLPSQSSFTLSVLFDGQATGERGFMDRYHMSFLRELRFYNDETDFRSTENLGLLKRYEIDDTPVGAVIWDVTNPIDVKNQQFSIEQNKAVFQSQSLDVQEFVIFNGNDFSTPFVFGAVANQNLRGDSNYDGLVITTPAFIQAANTLAQFHSVHDGLRVKVVTTQQVYNEFSSGRQDVSAIRDYAKFVYENGGNLKYLLLLGDCSYDYKNRINRNTNFVPTYESRQSFHPIFSYSSDDYFGFLEDDEGEWEETLSGDHTMEIGVGRLPAKSLEEANAMVEKIIYYCTSPNTLGKWRGEITYVADDGDGNIHARHVEDLSELIDTTYAQYNINKVLLDAFVQEGTGSSEKSPQAKAALKTRIKNGTFAVNFIGHGNERLWMEEQIFTKADIEELTNRNRLPIFVTATCEFGRYDDPISVSGAEELLLLEQGGGIALLTTSRPVFASTNFSLNQAFHENIFRKEGNVNLRLGDIIRLTKNEGLEGPVNRNFTLLGDPMMMPAFPRLDIVLNSTNELDTLSALEEINLTGEIRQGGTKFENFNGRLTVSVFDVKQSLKTLGQESPTYNYSVRNNAIFRGEAIVENGEFSFSFIVPKNISYQFQKGKMSLYAFDQVSNIDAGGSSREFVIGGSAPDPQIDNQAPQISAFMNDSTFQNGDLVGDSPLLIAKLEDENGITTTSTGVIQGITLTIGDEVINLNDFYTSELNDFRKGTVVYPLQDLAPGSYAAILKAWDTHNNSSEQVIEFIVTDRPVLFVYNPITYPNPVQHSTTFSFEHDREDEDLFVSLIVFSNKGEMVSKNEFVFENSQRSIEIPWQPQTNSGRTLNQGIYFSKLIIRSGLDGAAKEISQKLVIVN
ncbi:type IX secretion system sortase PorU [Ekhidna sp.]|uniref:type IX secretion system sortase PorU n=1 Tax=Ekhidna sp. TaxID=2608089 RepID=UPI00329942E9